MIATIHAWQSGSAERWNFQSRQANISLLAYELDRVPDFSSPRFTKLGDRLDDRRQNVAREQLQMLREIHSLGPGFGCSLRILKDGQRLRLFLFVRVASGQALSEAELQALSDRVGRMFPPHYRLRPVALSSGRPELQAALNPDWATHGADIVKLSSTYSANTRPFFYVNWLMAPQAMNDLAKTCTALLRFPGQGLLDVTLTPAGFDQVEREWLSRWTQLMREAQTGERVLNDRGKTLEQYQPLPELKQPVENSETILKRYDHAQLFLFACRVYATADPALLVDAISANAASSKPQVLTYERGSRRFQASVDAAQVADIAPEVHDPWWDDAEKPELRPLAAQRLHRLADVDEISGFFRLPIPSDSSFPGFPLDTGFDGDGGGPADVRWISLGALTEDAGPEQPAAFNREALAKHGLIVGMPGSGKTTAVFNVLHQLWDSQHPVPFIVLEPAKTEYRALKQLRAFQDDMLIFTLGDERISPFRFNPFEVPAGIPLESHIARMNACFTGAFNLFDPLPLLLDAAIRETYELKGWLNDAVGGDAGLEAPTLGDLAVQAQVVIRRSGYSDKLRDDFNAALTQRLWSLMRGSKGRMLNVRRSLPLADLMHRPIVMELDALNDDEKALLMMFILTTVYEYAKSKRPSGSPLSHVLVVEEAHNLIGRTGGQNNEYRANPREQAINLFVRMLAEMRALGQGILIADQLPTSLASEAVKNTNLKVLMRMTAKDDREDMANTMDLDAKAQSEVIHFRRGLAYVYVEDDAPVWAVARRVRTTNFKAERGSDGRDLEIPPTDNQVHGWMDDFEREEAHRTLFMPFPECPIACQTCDRGVRSVSEQLIRVLERENRLRGPMALGANMTACNILRVEVTKLATTQKEISPIQPFCAYLHLQHMAADTARLCKQREDCTCRTQPAQVLSNWLAIGRSLKKES